MEIFCVLATPRHAQTPPPSTSPKDGALVIFFFFDQPVRLVGSHQFPKQGLNSHSLQWKLGVSMTGPPGKSHNTRL